MTDQISEKARELAARIDKLKEATDLLIWATEIETQGGPRTRSFILQHRAKCHYNIEQAKKALAALAGSQNDLAEALAACRLAEAKWWEHLVTNEHHDPDCEKDCMYCERLATLERAAGQPEAKSKV